MQYFTNKSKKCIAPPSKTMESKLSHFIEMYGKKGIILLVLSPLLTSLITPLRFLQTLFACRVLMNGKWSQYNAFVPYKGINYLFYWTQAINFDKYGRNGVSPTVGLGEYKLSRWWHLTLLSTYMFWRMSNFTVIASLFVWLVGHFFWGAPFVNIVIIIVFIIFSSTFYKLIEAQNYNAVGWAFYPIGLYALYSGNWWLATVIWLLISFGSITVLFFSGIVVLYTTLYLFNILPILSFIPATIKILLHFINLGSTERIFKSIVSTFKAIGVTKSDAKYIRKTKKLINIQAIYISFVYILFSMVSIYTKGMTIFSLLIILFAILWYFNQISILRFADVQSYYILFLSISSAELIVNFSWPLLVVFVLVINPSPLFLGFGKKQKINVVPRLRPFLIINLINEVECFLSYVKPNARILFCFDDPGYDYNKIFDGYRRLLELPLYVASKNEFHLLPDWYTVLEQNDIDDIALWGRCVDQVKDNVDYWKPDWIILYDTSKEPIDVTSYGYEIFSKLDWSEKQHLFDGDCPYGNLEHPRWYLLKI